MILERDQRGDDLGQQGGHMILGRDEERCSGQHEGS